MEINRLFHQVGHMHSQLGNPVDYFGQTVLVADLIQWWAFQVLQYRQLSESLYGANPTDRTWDDYVGALHMRQNIATILQENGTDESELHSLDAVDTLFLAGTVEDTLNGVLLLEPDTARFDRAKNWWWARLPSSGPVWEDFVIRYRNRLAAQQTQ